MKRREPFDILVDIFIIGCILAIFCLKIVGVITLSWFWLLSPLWGLFLIGCVIAVILIIMCIISVEIDKRRKKNERY